MKKPSPIQETLAMTADSVGRDLLQALVQEIKLLPDVWPKIPKARQDDVIDRLRERVLTSVTMAVHLISADGRTVVAGDLEQITIKDGVKAVIKFSANAVGLHELYESSGQSVLVVVANPAAHTGGMDEIKGEAVQRAMDLGREYAPNSDGEGMNDNVVDAVVKTIEHKPLEAEKQQAYGDGQLAAQEGQPESDCPLMVGELCIEWVKGWRAWHEANPADANAEVAA